MHTSNPACSEQSGEFRRCNNFYCTLSHFTHKGTARQHNEDSIKISNMFNLIALADGAGGLDKGEVASKMTVNNCITSAEKTIKRLKWMSHNSAVKKYIMLRAIRNANTYLHKYTKSSGVHLASTIVMLDYGNNKLCFANAGDSRGYVIHDKRLRVVTRDHTLPTLQGKRSNILTEAVGRAEKIVPFVTQHVASDSNIAILCSDGLYSALTETEMIHLVSTCTKPQEAATQLVRKALDLNAMDDASAVVVYFSERPPPNLCTTRRIS